MCSAAALMCASGAWTHEDEQPEYEEEPCSDYSNNEWGEYRCGLMELRWRRLDPVIVEGLRPADVSTGSYSLLSEEDLLIRNAPSIASELRAIPGIGVSQSGGAGALTQVRMRGAEANHTLVFLDGVEMSDPATGETDFGLLAGIPISSATIVSGEQSAAHGSDAIGGVISLTTSVDSKTQGFVEIGSRDTVRAALSTGVSPAGFPLAAGISGFATRGVNTAGLAGERDGADALGVYALGNKALNRDWSLATLATYRQSTVETDPDSDFDGRLDDEDRTTESQQLILGVSLESAQGLVGSGYTDHILRASFNSVTRENRADGQFVDETTGDRFNLSWSPSRKTVDRHLQQWFSGLVEYEKENYERGSIDTLFGDSNQRASFETIGIGGEYRAKFRNGWNVHATARHDLNDSRFDDATTWRVGAARQFDFVGGRRTDAKLHATIGAGVKNPTFTELFGFYPAQFVGNPDLTPEESLGWEIGWSQQFENLYGGVFLDDVSYSLTYFEAELEDEIFTDFFFDAATGTFGATPANRTGNSERSGWEIRGGGEYQWFKRNAYNLRLLVDGSFSFIESRNDQGIDEVRVPETTASLGFVLVAEQLNWLPNKWDEVRLGLAFDYVGEQLDTDFAAFQTVELDPYTLVSATAEIPFSPRVSFTLRGDNLLDEDAVDVIGFNTPGRGLYIGFKIR